MNEWILSSIRIFVRNIDRSRDFYVKTLNMPLKADGGDAGFLLFDLGNISLVVEQVDTSRPDKQGLVGRFAGLSFGVEDAHAAYEDLKAKGVPFVGPPEHQPWGGTTVSLLDPDGNALSLVSGLV